MSDFVQNGNMITPARDRGNEIGQIPAGFWNVCFHPEIGFHLIAHAPMDIPATTYGSLEERVEMSLRTYHDPIRDGKNTNLLLTGNKGSGKTLLGKTVAARLVGLGYPVLVMDQAFAGAAFNQFMNSIVQRCGVFIDEFDKKYTKTEDQNAMLGLLDGTGVNNKMFILTSNTEKVSEFLLSRPSRLFYHWTYGKMELEILRGYCKDNLSDQKHVDNMELLWSLSEDFSFDVMQSLVEELNRYGERHFVDTICNMNISFGANLRRQYRCDSIVFGDHEIRNYETSCNINLIEFQMGEQRIRAGMSCRDLDFHTAIHEAFGAGDIYHYNTALFENLKSGKVKREDVEEDENFHSEMNLNFKFDSELDVLDGRELTMVRSVGGVPLILTFTSGSNDSSQKYFRKLFK